jgi:hypothetical protein
VNRIDLDEDDILRLLRSMALYHAKRTFIPGNSLSLQMMPAAAKDRLAATACGFFGLEPGNAARLETLTMWSQ